MSSQSSPLIGKHRIIRKDKFTHSTVRIQPKKVHSLTNNFLQLLRDIAHPVQPRPTNPLISFLNLFKKKEEITSTSYIPSIENMLSEQNINC